MPRFYGFQNRAREICGIDVAAPLPSVDTHTHPIDFNNKVDGSASGGMLIVLAHGFQTQVASVDPRWAIRTGVRRDEPRAGGLLRKIEGRLSFFS